MIPHEKWFERTFDFTVPATRFPGIRERLRGTPARLEERTRELPRDVLARVVPDRWSILENVGHLLDLEQLWMRRTEQFFAGESHLVPTDLANRRTHDAHHNARDVADLLAGFRTERALLVVRLDAVDDEILGRTAIHPRLGTPMRLIDLCLFVAEHDDHHLAAISTLLA